MQHQIAAKRVLGQGAAAGFADVPVAEMGVRRALRAAVAVVMPPMILDMILGWDYARFAAVKI